MKWTIHPYEGASLENGNSLKFDSDIADIERSFGGFQNKSKRPSGFMKCFFPDIEYPILGFRNEIFVHMDFGWRTEAVYVNGVDYFHTNPDIFLKEIKNHDPNLKTDIEDAFLSPKFGIAFDLAALDESNKVIGVFSREEMEFMIKNFAVN